MATLSVPIPPPVPKADARTMQELLDELGNVPPSRVWLTPSPGTATEQDLLELTEKENRLFELVDGTLVEKAVGFEESRVAGWLVTLINLFLDAHGLGICVGEGGMMRIAPGLVRIPDVSFISWERLPGGESPKEPVPDLAPDLAVEVLGEGNTQAEMRRKLGEYFDAGVRMVWLIDPRKRTAHVYTSPTDSVEVRADQSLDSGQILSGFSVGLGDLLDRGRRQPGA
jgi:Uma2 family endonuclease